MLEPDLDRALLHDRRRRPDQLMNQGVVVAKRAFSTTKLPPHVRLQLRRPLQSPRRDEVQDKRAAASGGRCWPRSEDGVNFRGAPCLLNLGDRLVPTIVRSSRRATIDRVGGARMPSPRPSRGKGYGKGRPLVRTKILHRAKSESKLTWLGQKRRVRSASFLTQTGPRQIVANKAR